MTIELNEDEIAIIYGWYLSAAGESASGLSVTPREECAEEFHYYFDAAFAHAKNVKALVDKCGFEYHGGDEWSMIKVGLLPPKADE